ncbi:hypothetical protein D3C77_298610 [compost metagenome]
MAGIEVLSGDLPTGRAEFSFGCLVFPKKPKQGFVENILVTPKEDLLNVEVTGREEESRVGKAASTGIAGGLLFGGAGLLLGGLLGAADKQKKEVTFTALLTDNRRFMGKTDAKTFEQLQALAFGNADKLKQVTPAAGSDDVLSKLERLVKLKEQGVLTEEEFQQQKMGVLAGSGGDR